MILDVGANVKLVLGCRSELGSDVLFSEAPIILLPSVVPASSLQEDQKPRSCLGSIVLRRCRCPAGDKVPLCERRGVFLCVQRYARHTLPDHTHTPSRTDLLDKERSSYTDSPLFWLGAAPGMW